jgi:hypothetical protein
MLKQLKQFLFCDKIVIIPPVRTLGQAVWVLSTLWICLLIINIFFFGIGINTPINLAFIVLTVITIIAYILGRRYWKNRK